MTKEQLKAGRERLGLTQREMAELFWISRSQYIRIEKGETPIPAWLTNFRSKNPARYISKKDPSRMSYYYLHYNKNGVIDAIADSLSELAEKTGVKPTTISSALCHGNRSWAKVPAEDTE